MAKAPTDRETLTPDQIKYGSMYLAASNLGMDMRKVQSAKDIVAQWNQTAGSIEFETGESAEPERKDWEKMLKKGDAYAVGVVKKELPFLFETMKINEDKPKVGQNATYYGRSGKIVAVRGTKSKIEYDDWESKEDEEWIHNDDEDLEILNEDHDATAPDGQPRDNFYVPSVMGERDVIENILDKFTGAGITHAFQGDDLIITAGTLSHDLQEKVMQDLQVTVAEVIKFLKDEYKAATGKALSIDKKPEHETFDCVANYTTTRQSLCRLTCAYELPNSLAADDAGSEKGEIRGNLLPPMRNK